MDVKEQIETEYIKKFDTVLAHTFAMYKSKQNGAELPPFMEVDFFNRAKNDVLDFHRRGLLTYLYERIIRGAV